MKKTVSISVVKNESDIIEPFIRYHADLLDGMLILDNGSTDGTREIISRLVAEDLPVFVIFDDEPGCMRSKALSELLYLAMKRLSPDFLLPLDADEFLISMPIDNVRSVIDRLPETAISMIEWITYVPTPCDDATEVNVLKRIRHRRLIQHNQNRKVIIPAKLARELPLMITHGSHDAISTAADEIVKNNIEGLNLAHYPIRTIDQVKTKYTTEWLNDLACPSRTMSDWYPYYAKIKSGYSLGVEDLTRMATYYDVLDKHQSVPLILDPLYSCVLEKVEIKYPSPVPPDFLRDLLSYSETLARSYSSIIRSDSVVNCRSALASGANSSTDHGAERGLT